LLGRLPESPFLRSLDASLSRVIPSEPVEVLGAWSTTTQKRYRSESQLGSGVGPFIEVEDRRWKATLSCQTPVSGIVFLVTTARIYWVKAPAIALMLPAEVSLHAYAGYREDRATLTAGMAGAHLPGVPVVAPVGLDDVCPRGPITFTTGRVVTLAQADRVVFVAVVLPRPVLKMGRNHLWRLRDSVAASLPPDARELLTRRRSGNLSTSSACAGS
jgi:hypothetical protein